MTIMPRLADRATVRPVSVVIADESAAVRGLFARWLGETGQYHVAAIAADGETALAHAERYRPEIMVLDLDMPDSDMAAVLPAILKVSPHTAVLLATTLDEDSARQAMHCMTMGAVDLLPKPHRRSDLTVSRAFRGEFLGKVENLALTRSRSSSPMGAPPVPESQPQPVSLDLRPLISTMPRYLAIGASTGGPRAVARVLADLGPAISDLSILIVQHMPPLFTASFADQLAMQIGVPAREPFDGERLARGTIYVAPGGRHLGIDRRLGHIVAAIGDGPPVRFCRPAVDVLFTDAARHLGPAVLGLVLTGMGNDGAQGAAELRKAGSAVIAQDEASSTIWGMPGSVVRAGSASRVMPLSVIGPAIRALLTGEPRA